jgi:RNA polymerase sigma factor (sigma-70 family)
MRHIRKLVGADAIPALSDADLLQRFVSAREETAFATLVDRYGRLVWSVCWQVLHHREDAEDAFQATFLALARHAPSIRQSETVASWLYRVAYRVATKAGMNMARQRKLDTPVSNRRADEPHTELAWRELQTVLHDELNQLPEKYRAPFVLCCLEGKTGAEAARLLGWKEGTVTGRLTEARKLLRRRLARRGVLLSAVLCAAVLSREAPAAVVGSTIKAAAAFTAGSAAGVVPAKVASLVEGVTQALLLSKVKTATMLVLALGVLSGAGLWAHQTLAAQQTAALAVVEPKGPAAPPNQSSGTPVTDKSRPAAVKEGTNAVVEVAGRVLDPNGKPFARAKLYLDHGRSKEQQLPVRATSGTDGRFSFTFKRLEPDPSSPNPFWFQVIAVAEGYGPDWASVDKPVASAELTLRLVQDLPIQGRILTLDGVPVKGATLRVEHIHAYANPEAFLQTVRDREWPLVQAKYWGGPFPGQPQTFTTGTDGRFRLTGVGRERVVQFQLQGPGIQYGPVRALAREMKAPVEPRPQKPQEGGPVFTKVFGATFDHAAVPSRPVRGVVRDKMTGRPVAGVEISGMGTTHRTHSDGEGRYELRGCPKSDQGYRVSFSPAAQLYFSRSVTFPDAPGLGLIEGDIELVGGILARGRVTHQVTGKPIAGARVHYNPLYPNPSVRLFGPDGAGTLPCSWAETGPDGSYRLVILPGPGALGFIAPYSPRETFMPALVTTQELKDFFKDNDFHGHENMLKIQAGVNSWSAVGQTEYSQLLLINPAEKDETLTRDVALQPAQPLRGKVVGPDGKPVAGVTTYHLAPGILSQPLADSTFTVEGLNPRRTRHLLFIDKEKQHGAFVAVKGEVKEPLTVRLEPCGSVAGRLLDQDGEPAAGAVVRLDPESVPDAGSPKVKTDRQGRFRIDGLLPGEKYQARLGPPPFGQYLSSSFTLKPGETKDLGDVQVKPAG